MRQHTDVIDDLIKTHDALRFHEPAFTGLGRTECLPLGPWACQGSDLICSTPVAIMTKLKELNSLRASHALHRLHEEAFKPGEAYWVRLLKGRQALLNMDIDGRPCGVHWPLSYTRAKDGHGIPSGTSWTLVSFEAKRQSLGLGSDMMIRVFPLWTQAGSEGLRLD